MNCEPGLSDSRKGSIRSAAANQERMSVTLVGRGKLRMAARYFWHGRTWLGVIAKPANSTVSCPNTNFLGFRIMPLCPQVSSQSTAWKKLPSMLSAQRSACNTFRFVWNIRDNLVETSREAITFWCSGQLHGAVSALCGVCFGVVLVFPGHASDSGKVVKGDVSPTVGNVSGIIPRATHASLLRNNLSESLVT